MKMEEKGMKPVDQPGHEHEHSEHHSEVQPDVHRHPMEDIPQGMVDHAAHGEHPSHATMEHGGEEHKAHGDHTSHSAMEHEGDEHKGHVDHTGHEGMFRQRFWICLALSFPVILFSPAVQSFLGFSMPAFPGSAWITPLFS